MTDVINLFTPELTPDEILERAKGQLQDVLVIGYDSEGELDIRSTNLDAKEVAFMCEVFLRKLYNGDYRE